MNTPNLFSILHALGQLQRLPHRFRFERAKNDPARAQARRLEAIATLSKDTKFSLEHGLGSVRTLRELQRRVPVQDGESLKPWVEREMRGERHALCAETPVLYASSTGTTGVPKRMPITESFRREFQTSLLTSMAYTYDRHREAFNGSILYYVSKKEIDRSADGTPIGFTSGFNFSRMPKLVQKAYAVPYETFEVKDPRTRSYLTAWLSALSPVTVIGAIFPLAVTEMLRSVEGDGEALVRDLRRGTLRDDLSLSPGERATFARLARIDTKTADRIAQSCRANDGKLIGSAIFPSLRLLYCWTSASAGHYVDQARAALPPGVAVADGVYAANEGWCNIPLADGELGGPVSIHGHFYEFVEESAWDRGVREGVGTEELETGKSYRILLTTSAGVFRYDVGDIIACSGFYGRTPRIHFSRRAGASYSLAGEKLSEVHVQRAVAKVAGELSISPDFFSAVPVASAPPRWEMFIEFPIELPADALARWRAALDVELGRECVDYADRLGFHLRPLALRVLPPGAYARYRQDQAAAGAPTAQSKVVSLETRPNAFAQLGHTTLVEKEGSSRA